MKIVGITVAGLLGGLLAGMLFLELVARAALSSGVDTASSIPLALLLGFGPILLAIGGAVAAPLLYQRSRRRRELARQPYPPLAG